MKEVRSLRVKQENNNEMRRKEPILKKLEFQGATIYMGTKAEKRMNEQTEYVCLV